MSKNLWFIALIFLSAACKRPEDSNTIKLVDNLHYVDKVSADSTFIKSYRQIEENSCLVEVESRFKGDTGADRELSPDKIIGDGGCLPSDNLAFRGRVDISREVRGDIKVALLIDNTGSLKTSDPNRKRWDGVSRFLDILKGRFSDSGSSLVVKVIFFNYCPLPGSFEHDYGSNPNDSSFRNKIKQVMFAQPSGETNYLGALNQAVDWLGGYVDHNSPEKFGGAYGGKPGATGHIVLFTDGMPYVYGDDINPACKLGSKSQSQLPYITLKDSAVESCVLNAKLVCEKPNSVSYAPQTTPTTKYWLNPYNFVIGFSQHIRDFNYLHENAKGILVQGVILLEGTCGEESATRGIPSVNSVFKKICNQPSGNAKCTEDPLSCPANRHYLLGGIARDNFYEAHNANKLLEAFEQAAENVKDEELRKLDVTAGNKRLAADIEFQRCKAGASNCNDEDIKGNFNFYLDFEKYSDLRQTVEMTAFTSAEDGFKETPLSMKLKFNQDVKAESPNCGFVDITSSILDSTSSNLHGDTFLRKDFAEAGEPKYRITCRQSGPGIENICTPGERKFIKKEVKTTGSCPNQDCITEEIYDVCKPDGSGYTTDVVQKPGGECISSCGDCAKGFANGQIRTTTEVRYKEASVCNPGSCASETVKEQCVNGQVVRVEPTFKFANCVAKDCPTGVCDGLPIGSVQPVTLYKSPTECLPNKCLPETHYRQCTEGGWVGPNIGTKGKGKGGAGLFPDCQEISNCTVNVCTANGKTYQVGEVVNTRQQCRQEKACKSVIGEGKGGFSGGCDCWEQQQVCQADGTLSQWTGGFGEGFGTCFEEDCTSIGDNCNGIPEGNYEPKFCYKSDCTTYKRQCIKGNLQPSSCPAQANCAPCVFEGGTYKIGDVHPAKARYKRIEQCVRSKSDPDGSCRPRWMTRVCVQDSFTGVPRWGKWISKDRVFSIPPGRSDDKYYVRPTLASCFCKNEILPPPILPPIPPTTGKGKGKGKSDPGTIFLEPIPITPNPGGKSPGVEPFSGLSLTDPSVAEFNSPLSGAVGFVLERNVEQK